MNEAKRKALEAAGWRIGGADEFVGLTPPELQLIDLRISVGQAVRRVRLRRGLTQRQLAERMGTGQPRVAKIEAVALDVSLDQLCLALFAAGGTFADIELVGPAESSNTATGSSRRTPRAAARAHPAAKSRG